MSGAISQPAISVETGNVSDAINAIRSVTRPGLTKLVLMSGDAIIITVVFIVTVWVRRLAGGQYEFSQYWQLWPLLGAYLLLLAATRSYSIPLGPPEELRRIFWATVAMFAGLGTIAFLSREVEAYSRLVYLFTGLFSVLGLVLGRSTIRLLLSRQNWWGKSMIVLGCGKSGRRLLRVLMTQPELGLKPVGILDDRRHHKSAFAGVPILGDTSLVPQLVSKMPKLCLVVPAGELDNQRMQNFLASEQQLFRQVFVLPDLHGITSLGVEAVDLRGLLALSVKQRLLDPVQALTKRILEWVIILLTLPVLLPMMAVIAFLIRFDSSGPVFIRHQRIGVYGRHFRCIKFRSMVRDADAVLEQHLANDDEARKEWDRDHKLREDPRITRVGRVLRRTSLDELPQLFNVMCGQMSLVGPRPIIDEEVKRYGRWFDLYCRVRPGITGLWQVSGRNDLPYQERVRLDIYYVRNWSVWMDLHIIARTIVAVLFTRGAY